MILVLRRHETGNQGTFGQLYGLERNFFTGELPWRENRSSVSCIPAGIYRVVWALSPRFRRNTYRILGVAGRDGILIHAANLMGDAALGFHSQLNGCVALGERLGWIEGQKAVLLSRPAVHVFEDMMQAQPFELEVLNA